MCQIQAGPSNKIRSQLLETAGLIDSLYNSNSDGLGFMFCEGEELKVYKFLPRNLEDVRAIIAAMPTDDRQVSAHWRYKTHGDIDLENCHPYWISEPDGIAMQHNGILKTGNAADTSKSDTWHFAKNYLAMHGADVLHDAHFIRMLADYIGNNRFTIMSKDGRMSIVNKSQGYEHDGVWYANKYSFNSSLIFPVTTYSYSNNWGGYGRYTGDDKNSGLGTTALTTSKKKRIKGQSKRLNKAAQTLLAENLAKGITNVTSTEVYDADRRAVASADMRELCDEVLETCDAHFLSIALEDRQMATLWRLMADYNFTLHESFTANKDSWSDRMVAAANAWVAKDRATLEKANCVVSAEALLYCTEWEKSDVRKAYDGTLKDEPVTPEEPATLAEQIAQTDQEAEQLAGLMGCSKEAALQMIIDSAEDSIEVSDDALTIAEAHALFVETPSLTLVQ